MNLLEGQVAVVIGGTSGIGAASAELLAAEGATVVVAGRREAEGEAIAAVIGPPASFQPCDVLKESDVEAVVARTLDSHERIDIVVNSAGDAGAPGGVATVDLDRVQLTLAVHLGGVLAGMKYAAPAMVKQGRGSIVNVASIGGRIAGWTGLGYSAAKAAVIQVTRCAAIELGQSGVRVNSVSPGPILTGIFGKGAGIEPGEADRRAADLEPLFTSALQNWQVVPRAGVPDDVAPAVVWLASDAARFITGHDLAVDGGICAGRPIAVALAERAQMAEILLGGAAGASR
jgi:NAD(P)-dependent dehydrogenase (short-subunit alcohol dehydrogenase family)